MPETPVTEKTILEDSARLGPDDRFTFACGRHLDCFTRCCRDVSIVLTPYDVLRLKRAAGMDSSEFLEKFTICPFTPDQKFPVRLLRMAAETRQCPFVCEQGCRVYTDRPWACRMYPLGVAEPRNATPGDCAFNFLVIEELCHGHGAGREYTVRGWAEEQGVEEYEAMATGFKKLTLHEFWDCQQTLTPAQMEMFHMACYDLDRFRRFVFESRFLEYFDVDEARIDAIRADDEELLDFAMDWLRFSLFREKTMKVKRSVVEARRRG